MILINSQLRNAIKMKVRNLKMKNLNHLAVIMDGNSRSASNRNLPSKAGHKEGVKKARLAVEYALEKKILRYAFFFQK